MRKYVVALLALALASAAGQSAIAADRIYGSSSYASQLTYDAMNISVRNRMQSLRYGMTGSTYASAPIQSSDALALAPSSRTSSVASGSARRQLDCVYYNGFTIWGDYAQTWASQDTRGSENGYRFRSSMPMIGFDYTTSNITAGISTGYSWGKLKGRSGGHSLNVRTWGIQAYGQWNANNWYANATLGYGLNRFRGGDKYTSHSWNVDGEFGYKFMVLNGLQISPNIGMRYFHDRRGSISERGIGYRTGSRNYHVWEVPVAVDLGYEINAGGALIVPKFHFAWVPELERNRPSAGAFKAPRRNRHGFELGGGLEAKLTKSLSAHIDYVCNFRSKAYEHHWNLGLGFTF